MGALDGLGGRTVSAEQKRMITVYVEIARESLYSMIEWGWRDAEPKKGRRT